MNDAILVGRGTVEADNPSLTCRLPGMSCRSPVRVVMDRRLRTPPTATLFEDVMVPVWMMCAAGEPQPNADLLHDHGAEIVPVPLDDIGMIDPQDALETLAHRGITRVLIEGGPAVAESFVAADLVDEAVIYQSPNPVGDGGLMPFGGEGLDRLSKNGHFTLIATRAFGPDRMTRWRRIRSCSLALSAA
jgi:diaminohydroxyphosphoribosylaminopyrimidine deaminase / 5-amino-6-(5-phosphoribosylamino)uracil reductase